MQSEWHVNRGQCVASPSFPFWNVLEFFFLFLICVLTKATNMEPWIGGPTTMCNLVEKKYRGTPEMYGFSGVFRCQLERLKLILRSHGSTFQL